MKYVILALLFLSSSAAAQTLEDTMWGHMRWLNVNGDLPMPSVLPDVQYIDKDTMQIWYYGPEYVAGEEAQGRTVDDIVALYDDETNTVIMQVGYDHLDLATASHLVHELVHYMQDMRGDMDKEPCVYAHEPLAYQLHNKWIDEFNSPEPHTDPLWLLFLETACDPRNSRG